MTEPERRTLEAEDGRTIPLYCWLVENPRAVLQLSHGLSDHADRYDRFADFLNQQGISVVAHDHRGHGPDTPTAMLGHIGGDKHQSGWPNLLADLKRVENYCREQWPNLPLILFGHSMGAQIARSALTQNAVHPDLCVLSALNLNPAIELFAARTVATIESKRQGLTGKSALMNLVTYKAFNRQFRPNRTGFDWISRDAAEVDAYVNDPFCGFACTNGTWIDIFTALMAANQQAAIDNIKKDLPILLIGGGQDPVIHNGKGLERLHKSLIKAGLTDIHAKAWPEARHEILNETNAAEVKKHILDWIEERLPKR